MCKYTIQSTLSVEIKQTLTSNLYKTHATLAHMPRKNSTAPDAATSDGCHNGTTVKLRMLPSRSPARTQARHHWHSHSELVIVLHVAPENQADGNWHPKQKQREYQRLHLRKLLQKHTEGRAQLTKCRLQSNPTATGKPKRDLSSDTS